MRGVHVMNGFNHDTLDLLHGARGGGGVLVQYLGGVFCWDPKTVTLFMTEELKIPYPVYDKA